MTPQEREKLILDNKGIVHHVEAKYRGLAHANKVNYRDVIQEGYIALCCAAKYFDPEKGKFSTYAFGCVFCRVLRFINKHKKFDQVPAVAAKDKSFTEDEDLKDGILELDDWVARLTTDQRRIIELRFGINGEEETILNDCGEYLGTTRERARQVETKALERLLKFSIGRKI